MHKVFPRFFALPPAIVARELEYFGDWYSFQPKTRKGDAMDTTQAMDLVRDAVGIAIKLSAPLLLLSMVVGVVVAIFQAVTQIHEQSVGFALKLIVVIGVLLLAGGWMLDTLKDYTYEIFQLIAS